MQIIGKQIIFSMFHTDELADNAFSSLDRKHTYIHTYLHMKTLKSSLLHGLEQCADLMHIFMHMCTKYS